MRPCTLILLGLIGCQPPPGPGEDPADTDPTHDTDADSDTDSDSSVVDADADGFDASVDCDDGDPTIYPGAVEDDCTDPVDRDCDGAVPLYADADADGVAACVDCDDSEPSVHPGAREICDGLDNDCDGLDDVEDEIEDRPTWYRDRDLDGYGVAEDSIVACDPPFGYVAADGDCDDTAAWISPFAVERCDDFDNDCDGKVDVEDEDIADQVRWFADRDGDGWGDPGASTLACDPPPDHVANDLDCDDRDRRSDHAVPLFKDTDGDGYGDPRTREPRCDRPSGYTADDSDCDDADASVHPAATELCDGVDNDCDGDVDDDDLGVVGLSDWYPDSDGDGYGADDVDATEACEGPAGMVGDRSDCVDTDVGIHPGRFDYKDSRDNDCDGRTDEDAGRESVRHDRDVQAIWSSNCSRCHGSSGGLSLRADGWKTLVNQPTAYRVDYVEPGYPSRSYLWLKLNNLHLSVGGAGRSMPTTGPITQAELDTVETWILEGAVQ